jgi:hypothetical protein
MTVPMTVPGAVCGGMVHGRGRFCGGFRRGLFGESEVKNFHAIIAGDEDDIWLEIAMNDSFLVSGGKPWAFRVHIQPPHAGSPSEETALEEEA